MFNKFGIELPWTTQVLLATSSFLLTAGRCFSMMLAAGRPLLQELSLVGDAVDNAFMKVIKDQMGTGILSSASLLRLGAHSGLFNPLVLQKIAVGEETGQLEQMMTNMAQYYEREVDFDLRSLTAKIEPIMISIVAGMVLILALGILTPMWT